MALVPDPDHPQVLLDTHKHCPRCGAWLRSIDAQNALSRHDNKTYICSQCGTLEAFEDFLHEPYKGDPYWDEDEA